MTIIKPNDGYWPPHLSKRLGSEAPAQLTATGNLDLIKLPKTAFLCSAKCPGNIILRAYDQAAQWRDTGRCIIGGFHSPVEKECLQILMRGTQPIIICPARNLPKRIPAEWQQPLSEGRLLILSSFLPNENRVTSELATRRNNFTVVLADDVWFAHITPGGRVEELTHRLTEWHVPYSVLENHRTDGDG